MNQAVTLTFSLKYLVNFSKSSSLSKKVQLMMSNDVPLLVSTASWFSIRHAPACSGRQLLADIPNFLQISFDFSQGHIRYYLAPKIGDD